MANDKSGVSDDVEAVLNASGEERGPVEGSKGPDPEVWDDPEARDEPEFVPADEEPKGPDPAQWSEEARAARGASDVDDSE